jgi:hypothetical protein
METIRLVVERITFGDEPAFRVWSPDCAGLGIIAQTEVEALTLAHGAVAEFRKSRGQYRQYETVTLRLANDPSSGRAGITVPNSPRASAYPTARLSGRETAGEF